LKPDYVGIEPKEIMGITSSKEDRRQKEVEAEPKFNFDKCMFRRNLKKIIKETMD